VGIVEARVAAQGSSTQVGIRLEAPADPVTTTSIEVHGGRWTFDGLRVGVPHVVAWVDDADTAFDAAGFDAWGRAVRHHEAFTPHGTNVNLVSVVDGQTLRMRTWERGVEAETLACGTGAIASALCGMRTNRVTSPATVRVSSGEALTVRPDGPDHLWLQGSARFIARGTIDVEAFGPPASDNGN
jgi:diaminopimelate epimerase